MAKVGVKYGALDPDEPGIPASQRRTRRQMVEHMQAIGDDRAYLLSGQTVIAVLNAMQEYGENLEQIRQRALRGDLRVQNVGKTKIAEIAALPDA